MNASGAARPRLSLPWVLLFLLAFVPRALIAFQYQAHHPGAEALAIDEGSYDAWARQIAGGDVLGHEVFFQEPLYPYLLAGLYTLFGPQHLLVRLIQALLASLACVVVGRIGARLFGRPSGMAAGALLALHGPWMLFPCFVLKETLLLPLLALLTWALVRTRTTQRVRGTWLAVGAAAGLGALLRGNLLVLLPCFALWPLVRAWRARAARKPALISALCVLGGAALVLAPVLARNRAAGGAWVLTTSQAGTNLYAGNNAENPYGRAMEVSFVRGIPEHEAGDWRREAERRTGRALDASDVSTFWRDETLRSLREHPGMHLGILWNKLRLTLGNYEVPDNHLYAWDAQYVPLLALPWPGFGLFAALGLAGMLLVASGRVKPLTAGANDIAALFALYLATIVATVTSDRARLPLILLLAPFAGAFVLELVRCAREGAWKPLAGALARAALLALIFFLPALPRAELDEDFDEREFNLAASLAHDPAALPRAREIAAGLAQRHPRSARTQVLANDLTLRALRDRLADPLPSARAAAREELVLLSRRSAELVYAVGLPPRERFRAFIGHGWIELASCNAESSASAFKAALEFDPACREARVGFVQAQLYLIEIISANPARIAAAQREILILRSTATTPEERAHNELLWSRTELARGRSLLARDKRDEGQAAIQGALRALQSVAHEAELPSALRSEIRRQAGRIQLTVGSDSALESAERHFRAALALVDDPDSILGLAQALVSRAERTAEGRAARRTEAEALLARLPAFDPVSPAVSELRARIEALR